MANIGITTFVNLTKNAVASSAQNIVSGVAGGLREGLGGLQGSSTSRAPIAKQSSFTAAGKPYLHYPSDLGSDPRQANYILFTAFNVSNAKMKKPKELNRSQRDNAIINSSRHHCLVEEIHLNKLAELSDYICHHR